MSSDEIRVTPNGHILNNTFEEKFDKQLDIVEQMKKESHTKHNDLMDRLDTLNDQLNTLNKNIGLIANAIMYVPDSKGYDESKKSFNNKN